mmetsp:Transcript_24853/g.69960  ORF Transcript_24853/g.69960 Transcript_24853/m.69960 type:complete len:211 (+) Transcript_24853:1104-1736(+)
MHGRRRVREGPRATGRAREAAPRVARAERRATTMIAVASLERCARGGRRGSRGRHDDSRCLRRSRRDRRWIARPRRQHELPRPFVSRECRRAAGVSERLPRTEKPIARKGRPLRNRQHILQVDSFRIVEVHETVGGVGKRRAARRVRNVLAEPFLERRRHFSIGYASGPTKSSPARRQTSHRQPPPQAECLLARSAGAGMAHGSRSCGGV